MKKTTMLALGVFVLAGISACGNKGGDTPKSQTEGSTSTKSGTSSTKSATSSTKSTTAEGGFDISKVDYSKPTVVVEAGDAEALKALGKQNQNMETKEGTVVKITGTFSKKGELMSIDEKVEGGTIGLIFNPIGEFTPPKYGTKIELTGVILQGKYNMEIHAPVEHIKILE